MQRSWIQYHDNHECLGMKVSLTSSDFCARGFVCEDWSRQNERSRSTMPAMRAGHTEIPERKVNYRNEVGDKAWMKDANQIAQV